MALNCDSCGSTYTLNPATCNHCQAKMCSIDCYLRHVKQHPTQGSISTLVTDAEPVSMSSTANSYAPAAGLPETALTPSPTLNGYSDDRTTEHPHTEDDGCPCMRKPFLHRHDYHDVEADAPEFVCSENCEYCKRINDSDPWVTETSSPINYVRPFVVYLSGPMHGSKRDADDREMAAEVARVYSAWLWNHDYAVFSPQLNTTHMYYYGATGGNNSAPYMAFDLAFITEMADAILMLPGWEHADGCVLELELAELKGIPIWKTLQDIIDWEETYGLANDGQSKAGAVPERG